MQRYYILLKATGESGLPAWLPYSNQRRAGR